MAYKPIENYGVIGDLHTVALVGVDGSIDWCCLPRFDSPSVFAGILDDRKGGFFKIAPLHYTQHKQMYLPDSCLLLTRFLSAEGVGEVLDFMPIEDAPPGRKTHQIVRVVRAVAVAYASAWSAVPLSIMPAARIRLRWRGAAPSSQPGI